MALTQDIGTYGFGVGKGTGSTREDLLDLITNLDPVEHPWWTQAPKTRGYAPTHQWLTETLAATSTAGAIEGDDWAIATATTRPTRQENYMVIVRKDINISETERAVNSAGFKDAYQREIAKASKENGRNSEVIAFQVTSGASGTGASGTARMIRSFQFWQTATNLSTNVTAALGTANFNTAVGNAWTNGGSPEQCYVGYPLKRVISGFTAPSQNRNVAAAENRLFGVVDLYETEIGPMEIVLDRWVVTAAASATAYAGGNHLWFLTRGLNRVAFLRPLMHVLVGRRGDSVAGMVLSEWTLEVLNASGNYFVYGLPSS